MKSKETGPVHIAIVVTIIAEYNISAGKIYLQDLIPSYFGLIVLVYFPTTE